MRPNLHSAVIRQLRCKVDPNEYKAIRQLWLDHSVAEDARDIHGLMATLTEDCVYLFPWEARQMLFTGERVYFFNVGLR